MSIKHAFSNTVPDGTRTELVRPRDWNSAHIHDVSLVGNVVGQNHFSANDVVFQGGPNITLSGAVSAGLATLLISASSPQTVHAFVNSNGIVFGTNGSQVTASYTVPNVPAQSNQPIAYSAGGVSGTAGTLKFNDGNGVSFETRPGGVVASVRTDYAASNVTSNMMPLGSSTLFQQLSATSAITTNAVNTTDVTAFQKLSATSAITSGAMPKASSVVLQFRSDTSNITANAMPLASSAAVQFLSATSAITSAALHTSVSSLFLQSSQYTGGGTGGGGTDYISTSQSSLFQHTSATSAITSNAIPLASSSLFTGGGNGHTHGGIAINHTGIGATATSASNGLTLDLSVIPQVGNLQVNYTNMSVTASTRSDGLTLSMAAPPPVTNNTLAINVNTVNAANSGQVYLCDSHNMVWGLIGPVTSGFQTTGHYVLTGSARIPLKNANGVSFGTATNGDITASVAPNVGATAPIPIIIGSVNQTVSALNFAPITSTLGQTFGNVLFGTTLGVDSNGSSHTSLYANHDAKLMHLNFGAGSEELPLSNYFIGPFVPYTYYKSDVRTNWPIRFTTIVADTNNRYVSVLAPYLDIPTPVVGINNRGGYQYPVRSLSLSVGPGLSMSEWWSDGKYVGNNSITGQQYDWNGNMTIGFGVDTAALAQTFLTGDPSFTLGISAGTSSQKTGVVSFLNANNIMFGLHSGSLTASYAGGVAATTYNYLLGNTISGVDAGTSASGAVANGELCFQVDGMLRGAVKNNTASGGMPYVFLSAPPPNIVPINLTITTSLSNGQYNITLSGGAGGGAGGLNFVTAGSAGGFSVTQETRPIGVLGADNSFYRWNQVSIETRAWFASNIIGISAQFGDEKRIAVNSNVLTTIRNLSETGLTNRPILIPLGDDDVRRNMWVWDYSAVSGRIMVSGIASSNRSLGGTFMLGLYHYDSAAGNMVQFASDSQSISITASSQSSLWNGPFFIDFPNMIGSPVDYADAAAVLLFKPVSANATWFNVGLYGDPNFPNVARRLVGNNFVALSTTDGIGWRNGLYSTTTGALPGTIHYSQFLNGGSASAPRPYIELFPPEAVKEL